MQTFIKDPDAVLDYGFDWSDWLAEHTPDDTISSSSWSISPSDGLTKDSDSNSTTATLIWLSGGTVDVKYTVTNEILTAGGRTENRSFRIHAKDR